MDGFLDRDIIHKFKILDKKNLFISTVSNNRYRLVQFTVVVGPTRRPLMPRHAQIKKYILFLHMTAHFLTTFNAIGYDLRPWWSSGYTLGC